jgi:hypothetical protein
VLGALKRGLTPLSGELGLHVCGGRGKHSRATPAELAAVGERTGLDGQALARSSRLVAKVDSAAVQDGFDLYLHGFIVADDGRWVVVQQGMNADRKQARRYHWLSEGMKSFVDAPHAAIEGRGQGKIVNLTDARASPSRHGQLELLQNIGPDGIVREFGRLAPRDGVALPDRATSPAASRHARSSRCAERKYRDPASARRFGRCRRMRTQGFCRIAAGPWRRRADSALARHGGRGGAWRALPLQRSGAFFLAHGGKDRHPFPVPTRVYDKTIAVMKSAVGSAKLGNEEKLAAIRRLDEQARRLERTATGPSVEALISEERARSHDYGGRSIFGWEPPTTDTGADVGGVLSKREGLAVEARRPCGAPY